MFSNDWIFKKEKTKRARRSEWSSNFDCGAPKFNGYPSADRFIELAIDTLKYPSI